MLSPEETFPGGEVGALEEGVLQDAFHTTQGLDHVCAVVVQIPKFAIVSLMSPPERILFQHLEANKTDINNTDETILYLGIGLCHQQEMIQQ